MKTTPLQAVKTRFGDKSKLVSSVKDLTTDDLWVGKLNEQKGLESISNAKLLRLHDTLSAVKKDFGSRAKLIDAILGLVKSPKDTGYKSKLETFTTPRLLDLHKNASRASKQSAAKAKAAPKAAAPAKKKKARTKKAKAKAAAAAGAKK
jgi:hypothetical protein